MPDERIRLQIEPRVLSPGTVVTVKVFAPDDAARVDGLVEMFGSPRYRLKYDKQCACWGGKAMIPIDAMIEPGSYTMRAEVEYFDGSWGYGVCQIEYK